MISASAGTPLFQFKIVKKGLETCARVGELTTRHSKQIPTPIFMPVGTHATVRGQPAEWLKSAGAQVLLANTYHLAIRPGIEVFRKLGGLHRFMSWDRSILTDSGGFQILSLSDSRSMSEEGASFKSYLDGKDILLTPELSIEIQKAIGSDIMMVLDQCVPSLSSRGDTEKAMHLTHRWAKRSLAARADSNQALFAIVQGGVFGDLRKQSANVLTDLNFDGFAIGGLAVGETKTIREDITELTTALMPADKPRYLMGVGTPIDILEAVHRGVDMFDCIIPTAIGQSGTAFTSRGRIDLRRGVHRLSEAPIDAACLCPTCQQYSRAYIHHLTKTKEILRWQLVGTHNLYFYHQLMSDIRQAIMEDTFAAFYRERRGVLAQFDEENPSNPPVPNRSRGKSRSLGNYRIHISEQGHSSLQHHLGEIMHPQADPLEEANQLYIEQAHLETRMSEPSDALVVWDVGLGAATNAMALILKYEALAELSEKPMRSLKILSFENDLDALRLAIRHSHRFRHLHHRAPSRLLSQGNWKSDLAPVEWQLVKGNFLETAAQAPPPELVFFDPFSYKTDHQLWSPDTFQQLYQFCQGPHSTVLTYSSSTAARAGLLAAGFFVAKGRSTGLKSETTVALTGKPPAGDHFELLDQEWLSRWERSDAKFPSALPTHQKAAFEAKIRCHPQFAVSMRRKINPESTG